MCWRYAKPVVAITHTGNCISVDEEKHDARSKAGYFEGIPDDLSGSVA